MATGSMTLTGKVSSSSADYFGNSSTNGAESLVFNCSLSGSVPPANCVTFSITSISFSIKCTECATSKYRGTIYLGSSATSGYKLGVTPYRTGSDAGSITWSGNLSGWDVSSATLASVGSSCKFYLTKCESSSTGRKIYCKSSYGNSYVTINYEYTTNTAPSAPTIVHPAAADKITYNQKPWFRFTTGTDAEESSLTTYWRVDSGTWQSYSSTTGSNNNKQWTTALAAGSHTISAYCHDGTVASSTVSRTFTVGTPAAAITQYSVIDDAQISTMRTQINNQRAYYGLTNGSYSTITAGTTKCDDAHLDEMETALKATPHCPTITSVDGGATIVIAHMNNFRTALLSC